MKYSRANKVSELLLWYKKITILFESMLRLFHRLQKNYVVAIKLKQATNPSCQAYESGSRFTTLLMQ